MDYHPNDKGISPTNARSYAFTSTRPFGLKSAQSCSLTSTRPFGFTDIRSFGSKSIQPVDFILQAEQLASKTDRSIYSTVAALIDNNARQHNHKPQQRSSIRQRSLARSNRDNARQLCRYRTVIHSAPFGHH
ncbi:hypothetical protein LR48_Vigan03g047800 [Vigna angularis]|uniref:Uncharacterized protein n=1 Tax=Phaseolus angularis TaxID=3914 RepID=A0A0L9U355_PHAAN|nr:hypothetical protein LR48_Vigan03g047800 [Vigna angularis]